MYKKLMITAGLLSVGALSAQACSSCGCTAKKVVKKAEVKAVVAQTVCPLMGQKIDKKFFADHSEKRVYFCGKACVAAFNKAPEKYIKAIEKKGITLEKAPKSHAGHEGHDHSGHNH